MGINRTQIYHLVGLIDYQLTHFLISCRNGVIGAKYLPVAVKFDHKTKTLQPTLSNGTHWIDVCSKKDEACLRQTDLKKQG